MLPIDGDFIRKVAPRFSGDLAEDQARIISAISGQFAQVLDRYQINTPLRIAHFMGQVTHECAGFRTTEEFATGDAYEGRADLGNTQTGDGRRYKGRGLLQLTGRANYRNMGQKLNLPLEAEPLRAGDPLTSLLIACEYWKDRKINNPADDDDLIEVTKRVNGGTRGLEERRGFLQKAKAALAEIQGIAIGVDQGASVVILRRGSNSDAVGDLQNLLKARGFTVAVDNDFGAATELAVKQFQQQSGLTVDGIVGRDTWNALRRQNAPRRRAA